MKVQFEWQAGDEKGEWETIATIGASAPLRVPRWVWAGALALAVTLVLGGYLGVRRWHDSALRRTTFQIQSVIDLETRARARHDVALLLSQQDSEAPQWIAWQADRLRAERQGARAAAEGCTSALPHDLPQGDALARPQVDRVEVRGDLAWVEVIAGREPVRQVSFYRQTDLGWLHTAPDVAFWGEPATFQYGNVVIHGHDRDAPHVEPLVEQIHSLWHDVCRPLSCPTEDALEVDLAVGIAVDALSGYAQGTLTLPSPWLSGIPVEDGWPQEDLEALRYWVAYAATARFLRPPQGDDLEPLQRAVAAEYATWYAYRDAAQAPLLRRVIERHSSGALPELLHALREPRSLAWCLEEWLPLSTADTGAMRFETLLDMAREALLAGQRETFLLLQDEEPKWIEIQDAYYDRVRSGRTPFCYTPARVQDVEIVGDRALVTLSERTSLEREGFGSRSIYQVAFFQLQEGAWKQTWRSTGEPQMSQVFVPLTGALPFVTGKE